MAKHRAGDPEFAQAFAEDGETDLMPVKILDLLAEATTMRRLLTGVAELAVDNVPDCDMASLTMVHDGAPATVAASDPRARRVDETEYAAGLGPCLQAARTERLVRTDDVANLDDTLIEQGDPPWSLVAKEVGVTAALSVPVRSTVNIAAAFNLYRTRGLGWSQGSIQVAERLAGYSSTAVAIAYRMRMPIG